VSGGDGIHSKDDIVDEPAETPDMLPVPRSVPPIR
jgi:hypothetical protein